MKTILHLLCSIFLGSLLFISANSYAQSVQVCTGDACFGFFGDDSDDYYDEGNYYSSYQGYSNNHRSHGVSHGRSGGHSGGHASGHGGGKRK